MRRCWRRLPLVLTLSVLCHGAVAHELIVFRQRDYDERMEWIAHVSCIETEAELAMVPHWRTHGGALVAKLDPLTTTTVWAHAALDGRESDPSNTIQLPEPPRWALLGAGVIAASWLRLRCPGRRGHR